MWIVQVIKEQEEVRVMTSNFSDKGWGAVLDRLVEISQREFRISSTAQKMKLPVKDFLSK